MIIYNKKTFPNILLWSGIILVIIFISSFSNIAIAICNKESHRLNQQITALNNLTDSFAVHFNKASSYISARCFNDAHDEMEIYFSAIQNEPIEQSKKDLLINNGKALLQYIEVMQKLESGQREVAIKDLFNILDNRLSTTVMWHTTLTLSEILLKNSTTEQWKHIEKKLMSLNQRDRFWQADRFISLKKVQQGEGGTAINALRDKLSNTLPLQRAYELQAVLIDVFVADQQMLTARVYCMKTNRAIGENLLDQDLRLIYLKACQLAWNAAPADDPLALKISQAFDRAVSEYEKQL